MALGKRLINTGGVAACTTDSTDPFGDSSGLALYNLDYDASDASGNYDGTPTNVDFGVDGQINYGARFNGSSSYIQADGIFSSSPSVMSASVWFKTTVDGNILDIGDSSVSTAQNRIFFSSGLLYVSLNDGGGGFATTSATGLQDGNWHHIVAVWDDGTVTNGIKMYIDGATTPTAQTNSTQSFISALNLFIGANDNRGSSASPSIRQYFNGSIDQVRIFSKALSSDEVSTLYAETACVYTSTTDIVNYPTGTTPIAYYKLDNSSEDFSTGSYDGTDTNVEYRFGRFGQAADFNGSSSKIELPSALSDGATTDATCISFWFNVGEEVTSSTTNNEIMQFAGTSSLTGKIALGSTSGHMSGETFSVTHNVSGVYTYSQTNIPAGWNHAVVQWNSTDGKWDIYINSVKHTTYTVGTNAQGKFKLKLGNRSSAYYTGSLDQIRFYDAALTSDQVTELYNEKPEVDTSNFKTVIYDGSNSDQYISNVGFQPDLVWVKRRDDSDSHVLSDSVRDGDGTRLYSLFSDLTAAESTTSNQIESLDANGFFVFGDRSATNRSGQDYVAWVWKGGGDAVNIGVNSITASTPSIASDVSANQDAGFSIVKYTGDGGTATLGHGLSQQVEMVITKSTESTSQWMIYHKDLTGNTSGDNPYNLYFATNNELDLTAFGTYDSFTDSVFPVSRQSVSTAHNNNLNIDYIAYCFHSVSGYSKIGSYEGLGTSTVTVSGLGFKPSWIIVKNADDTANWNIYDSRRSGNDSGWGSMDTMNDILYPNLNIAEVEGGSTHVFTANSDGFVVGASNHLQNNKAGDTFIYMAFK